MGAALIAVAFPLLPVAVHTPALKPTSPTVGSPNPSRQPLIIPPEIVRADQDCHTRVGAWCSLSR